MAKLQTTKYTAEDMAVICEQLERSLAALQAVEAVMRDKDVDAIDVLYAKEFMRGLHKVTRFTGASQEALTERLLPPVNGK